MQHAMVVYFLIYPRIEHIFVLSFYWGVCALFLVVFILNMLLSSKGAPNDKTQHGKLSFSIDA